jgi:hypothetical protein
MTTKQPLPVLPGPDCATIAPLLPLLDSYDLSGEDIARVREHLHTCDWCTREYAAHTIVGAALQRHYSGPSQGALPYLSMEHIVNDYETQDPSTRLSTAYAPTTAPGTSPDFPRRNPSRLTGIVAVAAALLLVGLAATLFTLFTRTPTGPAHKGNGTPTMTTISRQPLAPLHLPAGVNLMSLSMTSPTDGWAVGVSADRQSVILLRYQNGQWAVWPGSLPQLGLLLSVNSLSMASPTDGWITGIGGMLHYTHGQWVVVPLSGIGSVDKVEMVSPTDGWAKGFIQSADKQNGSNGVLHYSNGSWSVVALPAALRAIGRTAQFDFSVTPAGECWLMYQDAVSGDTETLRYEGGSFQVAYTLPHFLGQTITMRSSQDGWLTGTDANGKVAYHFDGSAWAKLAIPTNFKQQPYLYPVVIAPSGEA